MVRFGLGTRRPNERSRLVRLTITPNALRRVLRLTPGLDGIRPHPSSQIPQLPASTPHDVALRAPKDGRRRRSCGRRNPRESRAGASSWERTSERENRHPRGRTKGQRTKVGLSFTLKTHYYLAREYPHLEAEVYPDIIAQAQGQPGP